MILRNRVKNLRWGSEFMVITASRCNTRLVCCVGLVHLLVKVCVWDRRAVAAYDLLQIFLLDIARVLRVTQLQRIQHWTELLAQLVQQQTLHLTYMYTHTHKTHTQLNSINNSALFFSFDLFYGFLPLLDLMVYAAVCVICVMSDHRVLC